MGDRELIQPNRVIAAHAQRRAQEAHLKSKSSVKATVDTSPPASVAYSHLTTKSRAKSKWGDEQARIEHENMLLLNRMRGIMTDTQNKSFADQPPAAVMPGEAVPKGSLNQAARNREMKRILQANESMLGRIQSRAPVYSAEALEREHLEKERRLAGMGRFPYQSATLPAGAMSDLVAKKPIKRYGTSRFPLGGGGGFSSGSGDEEEQLSPAQRKKRSALLRARAHALSAQANPDWVPIQFEFFLESLMDHLLDGVEKLGKKEKPPLPKMIMYLRNAATGEYIPHVELKCIATGKGHLVSYRGEGVIPGIDVRPEALEAGADRRIRMALFNPVDPAFSGPADKMGLRVPLDNTNLVGEARFSLAHFLQSPKVLYKLKVLKHGLPIAGPNFGISNIGG
jgi:hypothetical protein